jgi:hypothetical protein
MISPLPMTEHSVEPREAGGLRLSRHWLAYFALLLTAVGLMLVIIGYLMPAYTDPAAAERIRSGQECVRDIPNTNENLQCDNALWYRSMNALRTNKWSFVDGGEGLLLSGLTMCAFLWWRGRKPGRLWLTPKSSLSIVMLAAMCWLMQIPAYVLFFITEMTRGYNPHWADSIAIPISQFDSILLGSFLPYMAIWLFFVLGARLPVSMFSTVPGRPFVNAFWTGGASLLVVPIAIVQVGAILEGPTMMVPALWLTLWLALCARAAALTRHAGKSED